MLIEIEKKGFEYSVSGVPVHQRGSRAGLYTRWEWKEGRLVIETDALGFLPLFWTHMQDRVAVSDSLLELSRAWPGLEIDDAAFATFIRFGCYVGDDTLYREIKLVPPGARIIWEWGKVQGGGDIFVRREAPTSREDACEAYTTAFRHAMARCIARQPEATAVPLSAGRDSRHILLELMRQGAPPQLCVTARHYPPLPNTDAETALALARRFGLPIVPVDSPRPRMRAELKKNLHTDFGSWEHAWGQAVGDALHGRVAAFYDGINGGVLFGRVGGIADKSRLLQEHGPAAVIEGLLAGGLSEATVAAFLRPAAARRFSRGLALERMSREFSRHLDAANPLQSFYFWNRVRRSTTLYTFTLLQPTMALCPFLDAEVVDLALSLPPAISNDPLLQSDAITAAYPEVADIPFESLSGTLRASNAWDFRWNHLQMLRYALGGGRSDLYDRAFVAKRWMRDLLVGDQRQHLWRNPYLILLLLQQERVMPS